MLNLKQIYILLQQFDPVFTRSTDNINPDVGKFKYTPPISQISIDKNGILKSLKCSDTHKSMGPDGISNIVLKNCADEILQGLYTIFQQSYKTGTRPPDWRNTNITPVLKKEIDTQQKITDQFLSRQCRVKYLSILFVATC